MTGKLIVLEGGEGCGKSTQLSLLNNYLQEKGFQTIVTREPGGIKLSEQIREILLNPSNEEMSPRTELFLYQASRAQYVHEIIKPNLAQGKIALADRFYYSTIAYQGYGRNLDLDLIKKMNSYVVDNLTPDLVIILDIPVEIGLQRARKITGPKGDRMEQEKIAFHEKVRQGYLKLKELLPEENIIIIDATQSIEKIFEQIKKEINKILS